jgi:sugar lactone lactonase YvrE
MSAWSRPLSLGFLVSCGLVAPLVGACDEGSGDRLPGADVAEAVGTEPGADAAREADDAFGALGCAALRQGPLPVKLVTEVVYENEEIVFDGKGALVGKKGDFLVSVPAYGPSRFLSSDPALVPLTLGLRYLPNGDLVVAQPLVEAPLAKLLRVRPDGTVSDFFSAPPPELIIPNGVHADSTGAVWISDTAVGKVFRIAPNGSAATVVDGPDVAEANGVAFDEARSLLFYAQTGPGTLRRVPIGPNGAATGPAELVATIPQGRLDGIVLDACGNLYAVDNQKSPTPSKLWRVALDGKGAAVGAPRALASFDETVASATFGAGPGWDAKSLYVSSIVGKVFRVKVGVRGAAVPLPP